MMTNYMAVTDEKHVPEISPVTFTKKTKIH